MTVIVVVVVVVIVVVGGRGGDGWWSDFLRLQIWYRWIKLDGRGEDGIMW